MKPSPDCAEHLVGGDAKIVDRDLGMAAGHRAVDRVEHALDADRGIGQVDQEQAGAVVRLRHDDADLRALGAGDERLAAVDHPVIAVQPAGGLHHRRVGAGAALGRRLGHEEGRARLARHQRLQEARLLLGAADLAEQVHIALVGRHRVAGERPERRQAGLDQHHRGLALGEMRSVGQDVRRQHAGLARLGAQFLHQFVARAVRTRPRILLVGDHLGADEGLDLRGDGCRLDQSWRYSGRSLRPSWAAYRRWRRIRATSRGMRTASRALRPLTLPRRFE